jgi:hypothetical protein
VLVRLGIGADAPDDRRVIERVLDAARLERLGDGAPMSMSRRTVWSTCASQA